MLLYACTVAAQTYPATDQLSPSAVVSDLLAHCLALLLQIMKSVDFQAFTHFYLCCSWYFWIILVGIFSHSCSVE